MDEWRSLLKSLSDFFTDKESSQKGRDIFNKWYEGHSDKAGYLGHLTDKEKSAHGEKLFNELKIRLSKEEDTRAFRQKAMYRIAAILLVGAMLGLVVWFGYTQEPAMIRKTNPAGTISEFTLPDGSKVWLGVASTIKYPEQFGQRERRVHLSGEGFFEVTRNEQQPFIVQSGVIRTRVLGTSFNMKAYPGDSHHTVTVISGRVEVRSDAEADSTRAVVLTANKQATYHKETGLGMVRKVDAGQYIAWRNYELVFDRESFADIAKTLEYWFGVEVIFKDEALKQETFVYHFDNDLSLKSTLKTLTKMADFTYRIQNQTVIIEPLTIGKSIRK